MKFGERLRNMRENRNVSCRKLAALSGWDISNLCKMENGFLPPPKTKGKILKIAEPLNLDERETKLLIDLAIEYHIEKIKLEFK